MARAVTVGFSGLARGIGRNALRFVFRPGVCVPSRGILPRLSRQQFSTYRDESKSLMERKQNRTLEENEYWKLQRWICYGMTNNLYVKDSDIIRLLHNTRHRDQLEKVKTMLHLFQRRPNRSTQILVHKTFIAFRRVGVPHEFIEIVSNSDIYGNISIYALHKLMQTCAKHGDLESLAAVVKIREKRGFKAFDREELYNAQARLINLSIKICGEKSDIDEMKIKLDHILYLCHDLCRRFSELDTWPYYAVNTKLLEEGQYLFSKYFIHLLYKEKDLPQTMLFNLKLNYHQAQLHYAEVMEVLKVCRATHVKLSAGRLFTLQELFKTCPNEDLKKSFEDLKENLWPHAKHEGYTKSEGYAKDERLAEIEAHAKDEGHVKDEGHAKDEGADDKVGLKSSIKYIEQYPERTK